MKCKTRSQSENDEHYQKEMIQAIKNHKKRLYRLHDGTYHLFKKHEFVQLSYGAWAIDELLTYIYMNRPLDVEKSIDEFKKIMDSYLFKAKTEEAKTVFISALDTVDYILDELIMLGYIL